MCQSQSWQACLNDNSTRWIVNSFSSCCCAIRYLCPKLRDSALGPGLALSRGMSILPHIRRYRELLHSCAKGDSLGIADMLTIEQLGSVLRNQAEASASPTITAIITSGKIEQCVELEQLGPDQVSCSDCPRVLPGTTVGLRLDDGDDCSYLFRAAVTLARFDSDSERWQVQLALIGRPVVLNWGRGRVDSPAAVLKLEKHLEAA
jgi:hypothetical protein